MLCLKQPTDANWAALALRNLDAVLVDHAHCEMKAAANALSLIAKYPDDMNLTRVLADLACEEMNHLKRVIAILALRGIALGKPVVDAYASELRRKASELPPDASMASMSPLVDRLLVGALIEARSCERFRLLVEATATDLVHADLHAFWKELLAAEARHYRTFLELAVRAAGADEKRVEARLQRLAELEGGIVRALSGSSAKQGSRASIHG
jgi:tRNA-(ms[2]io[6]A)-hydroxylase